MLRTISDLSIVLPLASLVSLSSDPLALSSSNSLVVDSDPPSVILAVNVLSSYPITVSPSRTTYSVRNGGRRTAFSATQLQSFYDLERSPTAAQRRTLVVGRWIFSIEPVKER